MAGLLLLEKFSQLTPLYLAPHKDLDPTAGSMNKVSDNLRPIENSSVLQTMSAGV
jgi:hypothetical protein